MLRFRPNIAAMTGYTPGEQPQDEGFLKLNTNENPYPPSPLVLEAIQRAATERLRLYPDPVARRFCEKAAEMLGVGPDWILAGNGSDDILTIVTRSFVGEGDLVVYPYPAYLLYETLAQLQAARVERMPFTPGWRLRPERFAARLGEARLVFIANPNSPSGTLLPAEEIVRAIPAGGPLVLDEAYGDFTDKPHRAELVQGGHGERIIVTRSLSKSYSLAGIRFGYALARPEVIAGLRKAKDSYNCDAVAIAAATAALEDRAWALKNACRIVGTRRRLSEAMRARGFTVPDSQANFIWCTLGSPPHEGGPSSPPHEGGAGGGAAEATAGSPRPTRSLKAIYEALKARKVLVRYMPYPDWGEGLRITVGSDAEIDRFLEELDRVL